LIEGGVGGAALARAGVDPHDVLDADDAIAPGQDRHTRSYSDSGTDEGEPADGEHHLI
jgi:hypothetical protein